MLGIIFTVLVILLFGSIIGHNPWWQDLVLGSLMALVVFLDYLLNPWRWEPPHYHSGE